MPVQLVTLLVLRMMYPPACTFAASWTVLSPLRFRVCDAIHLHHACVVPNGVTDDVVLDGGRCLGDRQGRLRLLRPVPVCILQQQPLTTMAFNQSVVESNGP